MESYYPLYAFDEARNSYDYVKTLRFAKRLSKCVFQGSGLRLLGVEAKARMHRYDPDGWRG